MAVLVNKRDDPFTSFRFSASINGITTLGFSSIKGIGGTTQIKEHVPLCSFTPRLLPDITRFEPLVLVRGVTKMHYILQLWREQVYNALKGTGVCSSNIRRTIILKVFEKANRSDPMIIKVKDCWPSSILVSDLNAMSDELLFQQMTIQNEGIEYVMPRRILGSNPTVPSAQSTNTVTTLPKLRFQL